MVSDKNKRKNPKPYYDLDVVKRLASEKGIDHWFPARNSSLSVVDHMNINHGLRMSVEDAENFILHELCKLNEKNYSDRTVIHGVVCDIYGKKIKNIPWYIKIAIADDEQGNYLEVRSFHPPKEDLLTNSGLIKKY